MLMILSSGLYLYYWFYLTWKQLEPETTDDHYPVWHALTLEVPIYNFFRMYNHMSTVRDLAIRAGVSTSLSPGWVVVMFIVSGVLESVASVLESPVPILVMALIIGVLWMVIVCWTQHTLNQYWRQTRGESLRPARIGVGEVVFALLGVLAYYFIFFLLPVE